MRDYKGNTSRSSGPQRRRPAAVRKPPPKAASSGGGPRWLLAGLAAGLLVALLVFLSGREDPAKPDLRLSETDETPARVAPPRPAPRVEDPKPAPVKPEKDPEALALLEEPLPPPRPAPPAPATPAAKPAPSTATTASDKAEKPVKTAKAEKRPPEEAKYQFYDLLPSMEVEVPADALDTPPGSAPDHAAARLAEGAAPHSDPAPIAKLAPGEYFVIQAGSFRDPAEAQAMSAKLALRGLRTRVRPVTIPGQGKWYRLRSEPYHQAQEASEALQAARASGAQVMLIKTR